MPAGSSAELFIVHLCPDAGGCWVCLGYLGAVAVNLVRAPFVKQPHHGVATEWLKVA